MLRQSRLDFPGALHHIMARGIEKKVIFKTPDDYLFFIERLGKILTETKTSCYAWTLMNNHFHLLLHSGETSISKVMRRLLTGYAIHFNHVHKRVGHLFQNRYKSILCDEEQYLLQLVRYIHLNPLRSRLVRNLDELKNYPYSGHNGLMMDKNYSWHNVNYVLTQFGKAAGHAQKEYLKFLQEGVKENKREDLTGGGLLRTVGGWKKLSELKRNKESILSDQRILGESDFVDRILKKNSEIEKKVNRQNKKHTLDEFADSVCKRYQVDLKQVRSNRKTPMLRQARAEIAILASRELSLNGRCIGEFLNLSRSGVCRLVNSFKEDAYQKLQHFIFKA